ncbi:MAG: DUF6602 domain-containing protein [Bacteroidia bacterium]
MSKNDLYGYFGWKEFLSNRSDILADFRSAKEKNQNKPVHTEHGIAGEASIRKWLGEFLPQRYGVTSGYIIPDIIGEFKLYHYDVIIYDKINSPILWVSANQDDSEQGKKRAIPAGYVHSVIEVKSTFNKKTINEVVNKLSELNEFSKSLPGSFSCGSIFIELKKAEIEKSEILLDFVSDKSPPKFWGGMIMSCEVNSELTGLIKVYRTSKQPVNMEIPLFKDIDLINYELSEDNTSISFNEQGGAMNVFDYFKNKKSQFLLKIDPSSNKVILKFKDLSQVRFSKAYALTRGSKNTDVRLSWSRSNFADFVSTLLNTLDGKNHHENEKGITFGQVFDKFI